MYLLGLGLLLIAMKFFEFGPVATWSWFAVLVPFPLAMAWWWWADSSGWTKAREMDKLEEKKRLRRIENLDKLGMDAKGRRGKSTSAKHARNHHT